MIASTAFCLCVMKEPNSPNISFNNGYTTLPTSEHVAQFGDDLDNEESNIGLRN